MKNNNLTLLDPNQISVQQHDPEHDAQRVIVVGSDSAQIANAVREGLKDMKIEFAQPQMQQQAPSISLQPITVPELHIIKVPTIVKETEVKVIEIEKPITVIEIKVIEIERPIVIKEKELAFQRVEVPVIVKEIQPFPKILTWIFGLQALISLLTLLFHR